MAELDDLSTTDASNTARFPENMQFRNVNDGARALEGLLAREYKDRNMSLTSTGSSNAFAVTPNRTIASLTDGLLIGFTANHSITGAATLNVAGLGARPIVASNGSALSAGDIVSGQKLQVVYRSGTADFQLVGDRASGTSADMTARVFPVGGIIPWGGSTAPAGWLLAAGQAVSRTTYAELFAVYGTTFGAGDGSTTFNVPDYRGRTPFGKDDMGGTAASRLTSSFGLDGATLGAVGGAQSTTLSEANLAGHTHGPGTLTTGAGGAHNHAMFGAVGSAGDLANATELVSERHEPGTAASYRMQKTTNTPSLGKTGNESAHTHSVTGGVTASTGSGTAFSNVPPGIVQNWIILALPAAASAATTGVNGLLYQFSTGTSDTNPGTGKLAFNNASLSSATQLYINETDAAGAGMASVLALWDDSTSTTKGTLYVFKVGALSSFAVFTISGSMTDAGSYDKFTLTHVASGGSFAASDQLSVLFVPKGDKGDSAVLATDTTWAAKGDLAVGTGNDAATILPVGTDGYVLTADSSQATGVKWAAGGAGSGDVTAASAFATDNRLIRSDGTAKGVQASGVTLDDSANVSGIGTLANGTQTTTSTSASALAVGANGATNPVLKVNASTASVATGIEITGAAAAARVALSAISSGTDEGLSLDAKGAGTIRLGATSTGAIEFSRAAVPTSSDGAALGTTALMWSDLFLASGGVINFNNGDVTVTHSADALTFQGGVNGYLFSHAVLPQTSDGAALGSIANMWSDLFLASGAVVNFNNGNVTLTHAAGSLTVDGATTVSLGTSAALTTGTIELGHATDTTIARSGAGDITIEGNAVYRAGGTDVPLADGGTGASLADPNADRIMFWDDSAGQTTWLEVGSGLSITGTTLSASGASGDVTAASAFGTDNRLIRSDGTGKGVQASGIDLDDNDVMTTPGRIIASKNGALDTPTIAVTGTAITGGTATTTKPLVIIEPTGTTSTGWSTSGTYVGVNAQSGFSGRLLDLQVNGTSQFSVSNIGTLTTRGNLALSIPGTSISWNSNTFLTSPVAATLQIGNPDAVSPIAQTLRAQGSRAGTDTNIGGGNLTIQPGTGTGTGTAASLILRSPVTVASGTGAQTQTTGLTITSGIPYVPSYTVAGAPSAATAAGIIYVSNETGGAVLAFSDGTNWRRVTDRAIIA